MSNWPGNPYYNTPLSEDFFRCMGGCGSLDTFQIRLGVATPWVCYQCINPGTKTLMKGLIRLVGGTPRFPKLAIRNNTTIIVP
jgi:hypothetical protein